MILNKMLNRILNRILDRIFIRILNRILNRILTRRSGGASRVIGRHLSARDTVGERSSSAF